MLTMAVQQSNGAMKIVEHTAHTEAGEPVENEMTS
ncbi:hypothetical protein ACVIYH_009104 [Bradyrhizobium diazoefficiens]